MQINPSLNWLQQQPSYRKEDIYKGEESHRESISLLVRKNLFVDIKRDLSLEILASEMEKVKNSKTMKIPRYSSTLPLTTDDFDHFISNPRISGALAPNWCYQGLVRPGQSRKAGHKGRHHYTQKPYSFLTEPLRISKGFPS